MSGSATLRPQQGSTADPKIVAWQSRGLLQGGFCDVAWGHGQGHLWRGGDDHRHGRLGCCTCTLGHCIRKHSCEAAYKSAAIPRALVVEPGLLLLLLLPQALELPLGAALLASSSITASSLLTCPGSAPWPSATQHSNQMMPRLAASMCRLACNRDGVA